MVSRQDARRRADIGEHARQLLAFADRTRADGDMRPTVERAQRAMRELGGIDRCRLVARQALSIAVLRSRLLAAGVATEAEVEALIDPGLARLTAGSESA
jgi:hypothetical protein